MPDPRLPRGAPLRLAIVLGVAAFLLFPRLARADESQWTCQPFETAENAVRAFDGAPFVRLTDAQWQFLRGVFVATPDTPDALPPGDRAMMSALPDGSAAIAFVDGARSCAFIVVPKTFAAMVISVGKGDVNHAKAAGQPP